MKILTDKKREIWKGIVNKARADGDYSLEVVSFARSRKRIAIRWTASVAAAILVICGAYYLAIKPLSSPMLHESVLAQVYQDTTSHTTLTLSSGEVIVLDGSQAKSEDVAELQGEGGLDFRKLESESLARSVQTMETGRGKQSHVILSDGTKVWLNANSKLQFPGRFSNSNREVSIEGEVYFEVAKNKNQPFIVKSEHNHVRVLGTHFNVRSYPTETMKTVTLLEGSVEVRSADMSKKLTLKPAEQSIQQGNEGLHARVVTNPEAVIAWKEGQFYFEDADAQSIVKELERWYPVRIHLKEHDETKRISGRIRRDDSMKEVVEMLRFFDIEVSITER
ncbi:DUF4974 domain-containing protein [Sphingobacterium psychroaquaticum]|uniref:FecR family protein n=1 Tax=Sphingobacterium psychroaquaticum TaxID=561061 RepID=UPI00106AC1A8|nr:FecR domain-containing protein [Sphingobacterium psychroaquaticum]QBQ42286.1 DUF4974 domain-containing protein [Sphingobacterium psychroaquaticum]